MSGIVPGPRSGHATAMTPDEILLAEGRLETGWWGPGPEAAPTLVLLHEGLGSLGLWRGFPASLAEANGCGGFARSRFGYGGGGAGGPPPPPLPPPRGGGGGGGRGGGG